MNESTYRTLVAWQRAIALATEVYTVSKTFPDDERFSLRQQIRRCAISIASNIAEGRGRGSQRDYRHFLRQARGSLYELDTQVVLAERLRYCTPTDASKLMTLISDTARPLQGLISSLDRKLRDT
jgi:four helix bundle protein